MQFIISKPGIQKKEENQEKNAEYTVGLHNTKNERESKLYQITDILLQDTYIEFENNFDHRKRIEKNEEFLTNFVFWNYIVKKLNQKKRKLKIRIIIIVKSSVS